MDFRNEVKTIRKVNLNMNEQKKYSEHNKAPEISGAYVKKF